MEFKNLVTLDVRPILAAGTDPFEKINETLDGMDDAQTLLIINTFEPIPLLNILKKKGYNYMVERPEDGVVHSYIYKDEGLAAAAGADKVVPSPDVLSFEEVAKRYPDQMEVDVRHLEMPLPMVTILESLEHLKDGQALFVLHKKLPQYLLPELKDRGYLYVAKKIDEHNVNLIIYK